MKGDGKARLMDPFFFHVFPYIMKTHSILLEQL
jgi:hypothetical protein